MRLTIVALWRICAIDSRWRCALARIAVSIGDSADTCTSAMPFSGTISADRPTFRCSVARLTMALKSPALSGLLSLPPVIDSSMSRSLSCSSSELFKFRILSRAINSRRRHSIPGLTSACTSEKARCSASPLAGLKPIATTANGVAGDVPSSRRSQNRYSGSPAAVHCSPLLAGSLSALRMVWGTSAITAGSTDISVDQCSSPSALNTLRLFMRGNSARNSCA